MPSDDDVRVHEASVAQRSDSLIQPRACGHATSFWHGCTCGMDGMEASIVRINVWGSR